MPWGRRQRISTWEAKRLANRFCNTCRNKKGSGCTSPPRTCCKRCSKTGRRAKNTATNERLRHLRQFRYVPLPPSASLSVFVTEPAPHHVPCRRSSSISSRNHPGANHALLDAGRARTNGGETDCPGLVNRSVCPRKSFPSDLRKGCATAVTGAS